MKMMAEIINNNHNVKTADGERIRLHGNQLSDAASVEV